MGGPLKWEAQGVEVDGKFCALVCGAGLRYTVLTFYLANLICLN